MMGTTHVGIGLSAALAYNLANPMTPEAGLVIYGCAVIGSLLPDIDKSNTPARKLLGLPGHLLLFWIPHRGPTHSLAALVIVGLIVAQIDPIAGMVMAFAYGTHLASDAVTCTGIPLLWPYKYTLHLLPNRLRLRVNGPVERLLQFVLAALILSELALIIGVLPL
jgi:membrane-bound metal-dependent hydrolase YbcI (DUF457 family)